MNRRAAALLGGFLLAAPWLIGVSCYAEPQQQQQQTGKPPASNTTPDSTSQSSSNSTSNSASDSSNKSDDSSETSGKYDTDLGVHLFGRFVKDQAAIWTSPGQVRLADADWIMPLGLAMAGTLATDTEFSKHLSNSPSRLSNSQSFSTYGLAAMAGLAGGMYLWGEWTHDDHQKETGFLAAEAAANSMAVVYSLKYTLQRERPLVNNYEGDFWASGDGFPSEHAAAAWSVASVVAHEYPGVLTQILAYGMASAVSASRLTAKQHFPTDVLVGSAIGWLSGAIVYRSHHDPELGGSTWEGFKASRDYMEEDRPRQSMGTTFVELDSWVYPALDRLAGLGYIHTSIAGLRPWTRMECARLTVEAGEVLRDNEAANSSAVALVDRLQREFAYDLALMDGGRNMAANLESVYARTVSISGPALTDGYHFGQTVSYDFGRPFERGTNAQAGGAFRAALGPVAIYVRAEYQHAPGAPAPSQAVRSIIALRDGVPEPPDVAVAEINRPRLLDAYIGVNLNNWQLLIGRQSLSWGPALEGSMLWSDNAEPVDMVRLVNSEPYRLPSFLKYLGPIRVDQFIGRLEGHTFVPHPFIYGNKINLKPLPNLEIGYGRTVTIGGEGGDPLTLGNFFHSYFGLQSGTTLGTSVPGDSHSVFDWTFNVPKTRSYLVFYGDWYADDNFIAMQSPTRSAYRPGIFITHFPRLPKLDLHLEAANTATPNVLVTGGGDDGNLNYYNSIYRDGYTNAGNLIGNTVGRMGKTYQGWFTYWLTSRDGLQLTYKNNAVASAFIPGGGAWQDYGVDSQIYLKSGFYVKSQVQYENISHFPILFNGPQHNITAIVEFGFLPSGDLKGARGN